MDEIKEKIALAVFVFSAIALLILFLFPLQVKTTGRVIEGIEEAAGFEKTCSDSDSRNYDVRGGVSYCDDGGCSTEQDYCSGKKVVEWYCENNERNYEERECSYDCDDGSCVSLVTKYYNPYSGGGGGGGGGSVVVTTPIVIPAKSYDLGGLASEQTLEIIKGESINFKIANTDYSLKLDDNTESQGALSISGEQFSLKIGEDTRRDLNDDGVNDLYVRVRAINILTGKVKITLNLA